MSKSGAGQIILLYSVDAKCGPDAQPPYLSGVPGKDDLELLGNWLAELDAITASERLLCFSWEGGGFLPNSDFFDSLPDWQSEAAAQLSALGIRGKILAEGRSDVLVDGPSDGQASKLTDDATQGLAADLFLCVECSSTFDIAWLLSGFGLVSSWTAVLAMRQRDGRGQMRREWHSPAGNLHVSFCLPENFLQMEAASVLTAALLVESFAGLGLELKLKWPNDLVLHAEGRYGKLGGILLEERSGILLAGLGLNCAYRPDDSALRRDAAMSAALLSQSFTPKTPISIWLELVQKMILLYERTFQTTPAVQLLHQSEKYLLWKGSEVQVRNYNDSGSAITGIVCGLTELGGLRLLVPSQGAFHSKALNRGQFDPSSFTGPSGVSPMGHHDFPGGLSGAMRVSSGFEELELYSGSVKGAD
ncbi:hypothetical protein LJC48_01335 [Desulfovibrio sp. OttesenSCG-928-C06]|nr:hypothetical protein [Desulfovibrio sp. OttesenSCG-928-C06]